MLASLFPLVDKDFPNKNKKHLNMEEIKSSVNILIRQNLHISKQIFSQLYKEQQAMQNTDYCNHQELYLGFKHAQILFEYLEHSLSTLNLCVSQSSIS